MRTSIFRMWLEGALACVSAMLLLATLAWPDWIELAFGVDPDGGGGELEKLLAVAFALSAAGFSLLTRRDRRILAARTDGAA